MAKKKATADELDARATANGYQRRAHREEDSRRDGNKHGDKTRKDQDATLDLCDIRECYLHPKTIDTEVESQLALHSDKKGYSQEGTSCPRRCRANSREKR